MKRGEVWLASLREPMGRRPVVLLSRDEAYHIRASVTVALVTTTIRHIHTEVLLTPKEGLAKRCVVNLDDVLTVHTSRLEQFITRLSPEKIDAVDAALKFALGIP
ncbi:MAG: type II toxin-antitoxin system PemK/MazF family toxin [Candidatus Omnitrophota bacterium]|nr:type II toxin-antitoxin system PemK/MazF family toxin [Candidatus Omnitrophota bacterium]